MGGTGDLKGLQQTSRVQLALAGQVTEASSQAGRLFDHPP